VWGERVQIIGPMDGKSEIISPGRCKVAIIAQNKNDTEVQV
jgi:hypothetical protein